MWPFIANDDNITDKLEYYAWTRKTTPGWLREAMMRTLYLSINQGVRDSLYEPCDPSDIQDFSTISSFYEYMSSVKTPMTNLCWQMVIEASIFCFFAVYTSVCSQQWRRCTSVHHMYIVNCCWSWKCVTIPLWLFNFNTQSYGCVWSERQMPRLFFYHI